jgi:cytochrome P450
VAAIDDLLAATTLDELEADPYPLYARLRAERPVAWIPVLERWVVTRWDDCHALTDRAVLRNSSQELDDYFGMPNILSMEGPEHRGLRQGVDRRFRPQAIRSGFEELARPIARRYVERVRAQGRCDATTDVLEPISVRVIGDMLGFADVDDATLQRWFHALSADMVNFAGDPAVRAEGDRARAEIDVDLRDRIARLVREPDGSALSEMVHVGTADGAPRGFDDLISSMRVIILGGFQEPGHGAANTLLGLLSDDEQLALALADPATALPGAVHEGLRWIAPFGFAERRALEDVEIQGVAIPAGAEMALVLSSCNRDESRYDDPDRFDLRRERIPHASFGFGTHYCSGHAVTRPLEEIMLGEMLAGLPGLRADPERPPVVHGVAVRGAWSLPVVWDA